ncbi:MAG TPA: hypothetical protein VMV10_03670 [Pirellulales bacterium]|nr:hypothetical protein [Pirellulales bacterium]
MNDLGQNIAALSLVALAAGYLLRQAWRLFAVKPARACGGCSGCSARPAAGPPVVPLELSPRRLSRED